MERYIRRAVTVFFALCIIALIFAVYKHYIMTPVDDVEDASIISTTCVTTESIDISETVPPTVRVITEKQYSLTNDEIELIALVTMAEAEGEPELGQRLVIDTILNRVDHKSPEFPDTVRGVIYKPNQFEAMWNGRVDRCEVRDHFVRLVKEELESRTNYHVMFFQLHDYSKYGTPMFSLGNHYFSEY